MDKIKQIWKKIKVEINLWKTKFVDCIAKYLYK